MTAGSTRQVRVRLFGKYRDLAPGSWLELDLPPGATVGDLVSELHRQELGPLPARPVVAVNHRPAGDGVLLEPDDEIALIPPVAGG